MSASRMHPLASSNRSLVSPLLLLLAAAAAAHAYQPVIPAGRLKAGPGRVIDVAGGLSFPTVRPDQVWGKEYVNDRNVDGSSFWPVNSDSGQIVLWDGGGNTVDGLDYSGTRPNGDPFYDTIDAIANSRDTLYQDVLEDRTALVFSYNNEVYGRSYGYETHLRLPSHSPLSIGGQQLGGAGELTIARPGSVGFRRWATHTNLDARPGPMPEDVAGVELWGPEYEDRDGYQPSDADKYSLVGDEWSGGAVWNGDGSVYLGPGTIASAVQDLVGRIPNSAYLAYGQGRRDEAFNIDALMVHDVTGSSNVFDRERLDFQNQVDQDGRAIDSLLANRGDSVIFSLEQIVDPLDPSGYYLTGSELFVLDHRGRVSYLNHSGSQWDKDFALRHLTVENQLLVETDTFVDYAVLDINAIEGIGDLVVESSGIVGDFNNDALVNAADFTLWRDNRGKVGCGLVGDANRDCVVDGLDRDAWASNYNATGVIGPSMSVAVPEPAAALLACGVLLSSVASRRRD